MARIVWDPVQASLEGKEVLEHLARRLYPKYMDTAQKKEEERRKTILLFRSKHGVAAAEDAFHVSGRTMRRWSIDLTPKSKAHKSGYKKRKIEPKLEVEIIRLRALYPRLGKEKMWPLLTEFCIAQNLVCPSESTIGRILQQLKAEGKLGGGAKLRLSARTGKLLEKKELPPKKKLRRAGYLPENPGDLLQVDGVLTHVFGQRRYTFTAVDLVSRWTHAKTYKTASSRNGADFLRELLNEAPFPISHIQTDNGSEFMKEFREETEKQHIVHYFNWVKQPKYQGWVERFNRTIQEEFLNHHFSSLSGEPSHFNQELTTWLSFYNTKRVHRSLGKPGQRLAPLQYLATTASGQRG